MAKRERTKMSSYCPPRILQAVEVMLEGDLLAASVLMVRSTGQQIEVVQDNQDWFD